MKPKVLVPPATWSYTTQDPGSDAWTGDGFDDRAWHQGQAGFGDPTVTQSGALTVVNTPLPGTAHIWMRTGFEASPNSLRHPAFYLRNSGPVKIYLNGELSADISGHSDTYHTVPLDKPELLRDGHNTMAVLAANTQKLVYFDLGVVDLVAP